MVRTMKQILFILVYGLSVACIGFAITTVFQLPSALSVILVVPAVLLADRVGAGFGVQLFKRDEPSGAKTLVADSE